jgi:hypothetical protein
MNVVSWHAVNFVLHGVASWLVFLIAAELGSSLSTAIWIGAIFCVLPIHSEAVAWVVGRAELLAAIGYAAALWFSLRYRRLGEMRHLLGSSVSFLAVQQHKVHFSPRPQGINSTIRWRSSVSLLGC